MGFSRQEYWSGLPCPPLGGLLIASSGFPGVSVVKNPPANAGDVGCIPGSRRFPVEGNGYPLQYSCLGNPMDRGDWQLTVQGVAKSQTQLRN